MSDYAGKFIARLQHLEEHDRAGLSALRRSLAFDPGSYVPAFPYIEPFVNAEWSAQDSRRRALYIIAGLFAQNPLQCDISLAGALGKLHRREESASIEKRFIALLGADPENLHTYLRQVGSLLSAHGIGCDYDKLFGDVSRWTNPHLDPEWRDAIRQRWARDFYGYRQETDATDPETTASTAHTTT
jgi:CRISPR system Cascade subunit CasB